MSEKGQYDIYFGLDQPFAVKEMVMAFDFGTKRIGVAIGQAITQTASPLKPLSAEGGNPNWEELTQLFDTWKPEAVVVGIPIYHDCLDEPITKATLCFARRLKHRLRVPVFGMDETLTSCSARQELYEKGGSRLIEKYSVDSMAAKLILESWLRTYCGGSL